MEWIQQIHVESFVNAEAKIGTSVEQAAATGPDVNVTVKNINIIRI